MYQYEINKTAAVEISPEQKLAITGKRLLITIVFCCIGWPVFLYAFNYTMNLFIIFLGGAIVSTPIFFIMARGGSLKDVFKTDEYEVITLYRERGKMTDGGFKLFVTGFIAKFFTVILVLLAGGLITLALLFLLIIRYINFFFQVNEKPSFIRSAFPIVIAGLMAIAVSGFAVNGIANTREVRARSSDYKPAEVGRMIEETKKHLLANSFGYSFPQKYLRVIPLLTGLSPE